MEHKCLVCGGVGAAICFYCRSGEYWCEIPGCGGWYEASNLGRVRSWKSVGRSEARRKTPLVLKQTKNLGGYPMVGIYNGCSSRKYRTVHRLILETFAGTCPSGMEGCHNNGVRDDNRISNLRWDYRCDNHADKKTHGTWQGLDVHGMATISNDTALELKSFLISEFSIAHLSRVFGVKRHVMDKIKSEKNWRFV